MLERSGIPGALAHAVRDTSRSHEEHGTRQYSCLPADHVVSRARLHQNMHAAPPGKATSQRKSRERSFANTDSEMTKVIVFKHQ